jgi:hypothetical protein
MQRSRNGMVAFGGFNGDRFCSHNSHTPLVE